MPPRETCSSCAKPSRCWSGSARTGRRHQSLCMCGCPRALETCCASPCCQGAARQDWFTGFVAWVQTAQTGCPGAYCFRDCWMKGTLLAADSRGHLLPRPSAVTAADCWSRVKGSNLQVRGSNGRVHRLSRYYAAWSHPRPESFRCPAQPWSRRLRCQCCSMPP